TCPPACTAWALAIRIAGQHLLPSPCHAFQRNKDRRSTARLLACPDRNRYSEAAFRSPATRTRFRAPSRGQCSWPTSFLSHRTFTESAPVRCSRMPRQPPLPLGGFYAPPDLSVQLV